MVPETKRKSEKLVVGLMAPQATKAKMGIVEKSESKVARAAGDDLCASAKKSNDVAEKLNMAVLEAENPDINITDGLNPGGGGDGDATDEPSGSLSSFQDTFSDGDGGLGMSDDEINSEFHGSGQPGWGYQGYDEAFRMRKKKVTSHWRNFIRPIMWRCKWAELQMRKFQIQASMYTRLLDEYDQARQTQKENFDAESQCARSLPFPHQMKHRKIMKRKKRKRVEDTTDVASYMLQHNLFAFCENKGTSTDHAHLTNGYANPMFPAVINGGVNLVDNDALVQFDEEETSLERILVKLDSVQSKVHYLTTRVDKVINENHARFSSLDKLSLLSTPSDSDAITALDPTTLSSDSDKDKVIVTSPSMKTQLASEHQVDELSVPVIPVTAYQMVDSLPSIFESADQPVVANKSDNAEDETSSKKRPVASEVKVYRRGTLSANKCKMLSEKQSNSSSSVSAMKPRKGVSQTQNERSSLFLASRFTDLRNNQKKRGKRKGASTGNKTSEES